jgi:hypothetical protein
MRALSIASRVVRVRSSTSAAVRDLVGMGGRTVPWLIRYVRERGVAGKENLDDEGN